MVKGTDRRTIPIFPVNVLVVGKLEKTGEYAEKTHASSWNQTHKLLAVRQQSYHCATMLQAHSRVMLASPRIKKVHMYEGALKTGGNNNERQK